MKKLIKFLNKNKDHFQTLIVCTTPLILLTGAFSVAPVIILLTGSV